MRPFDTACAEADGKKAKGDRPRRSVFIYLPNGVSTLDYQITKAGADYEFSRSLAPLATFSSGEEGQGLKIPEIGVTQDRHSLSHHNGNPKLLADLTRNDTFNIQQFGYFLDRLSEVTDADGPLLETTMALYGSGMAFGHSHGNANLPLVLAGGSKLGLKHGSHIDYNLATDFAGYQLDQLDQLDQPGKHYHICHKPVNQKAHFSNLPLTMAQKMGVETDRFADSTGTLMDA